VAGLLFSIAACGVVKSRDEVIIFFLQVKLNESVVGQKTGYKNSYSSTSVDILDWVCKTYWLSNFDMYVTHRENHLIFGTGVSD